MWVVYLVVMHAKFFKQRPVSHFGGSFVSLAIVHLWELAAITSFLFRVVSCPFCLAAHLLS